MHSKYKFDPLLEGYLKWKEEGKKYAELEALLSTTEEMARLLRQASQDPNSVEGDGSDCYIDVMSNSHAVAKGVLKDENYENPNSVDKFWQNALKFKKGHMKYEERRKRP